MDDGGEETAQRTAKRESVRMVILKQDEHLRGRETKKQNKQKVVLCERGDETSRRRSISMTERAGEQQTYTNVATRSLRWCM